MYNTGTYYTEPGTDYTKPGTFRTERRAYSGPGKN